MNLTFFLTYCLVMTITPGPTNILILSTIHNHGKKEAIWFCYGSTIGFGLTLTLGALLNTVLMRYTPPLLVIMQWIGSAYLLYLAYQITFSHHAVEQSIEHGSFKRGIILQFINPKVVTFCLTVFPSFILPYYTSNIALMLFVMIITFIGAFSFFIWVTFGSLLMQWMRRYHQTVNGIMALFLVYLAILISGILEYF